MLAPPQLPVPRSPVAAGWVLPPPPPQASRAIVWQAAAAALAPPDLASTPALVPGPLADYLQSRLQMELEVACDIYPGLGRVLPGLLRAFSKPRQGESFVDVLIALLPPPSFDDDEEEDEDALVAHVRVLAELGNVAPLRRSAVREALLTMGVAGEGARRSKIPLGSLVQVLGMQSPAACRALGQAAAVLAITLNGAADAGEIALALPAAELERDPTLLPLLRQFAARGAATEAPLTMLGTVAAAPPRHRAFLALLLRPLSGHLARQGRALDCFLQSSLVRRSSQDAWHERDQLLWQEGRTAPDPESVHNQAELDRVRHALRGLLPPPPPGLMPDAALRQQVRALSRDLSPMLNFLTGLEARQAAAGGSRGALLQKTRRVLLGDAPDLARAQADGGAWRLLSDPALGLFAAQPPVNPADVHAFPIAWDLTGFCLQPPVADGGAPHVLPLTALCMLTWRAIGDLRVDVAGVPVLARERLRLREDLLFDLGRAEDAEGARLCPEGLAKAITNVMLGYWTKLAPILPMMLATELTAQLARELEVQQAADVDGVPILAPAVRAEMLANFLSHCEQAGQYHYTGNPEAMAVFGNEVRCVLAAEFGTRGLPIHFTVPPRSLAGR